VLSATRKPAIGDWIPINQALAKCSVVVYNATAPQSCRVLFTKSHLTGPLVISSSHTALDVVTGGKLELLPRLNFKQYFNALNLQQPRRRGLSHGLPQPELPNERL
jgi:hypothetical protein